MKFSAFFLTLTCMQVSASAISQKISISVNNAPMGQVIKMIKKQTGYQFIYNNELLNTARPVTANISEGSIEQVLKQCFDKQPLSYSILEKTIVVKPKAQEAIEKHRPIEVQRLESPI